MTGIYQRTNHKTAIFFVAILLAAGIPAPAVAAAAPSPAAAASADAEPGASSPAAAGAQCALSSPGVTLGAIPVPSAASDGRGQVIEHLVPMYLPGYYGDPFLQAAVIDHRRWEYSKMFPRLNDMYNSGLDRERVLRLSVDALLIQSRWNHAIAALQEIVSIKPNDNQALFLLGTIYKTLETTDADVIAGENYRCTLLRLRTASPTLGTQLDRLMRSAEKELTTTVESTYSGRTPGAIAVFGESPNIDGTISPGLQTRLDKALEMANRFPEAIIIASGGAVRTPFPEAEVIATYLIENGISSDRILKDNLARDTVGNVISMVRIFKERSIKNVLVVATRVHAPRAQVTLRNAAESAGLHVTLSAVGGGNAAHAGDIRGQMRLGFITAIRGAGLFEPTDFSPAAASAP